VWDVGCGMGRDEDDDGDGDFWGVGEEQRRRGGGEKGEMGREGAWWGVDFDTTVQVSQDNID